MFVHDFYLIILYKKNHKGKNDLKRKRKRVVDTQFCTHDLINENDLNDHQCTKKSFLYYMHHL